MELFDFGIPALDKALNLTATVLLLLALGMLLIRVILRLCGGNGLHQEDPFRGEAGDEDRHLHRP